MTDNHDEQLERTSAAINALATESNRYYLHRVEHMIDPRELEAAAAALLRTAEENRERAAGGTGATPLDLAPRNARGDVYVWHPVTGKSLNALERRTGVSWTKVLDSKGRYWKYDNDWWVEYDPADPTRTRAPWPEGAATPDPEDPEHPWLGDMEELTDLDPEALPVYRLS